MIAIEFYGCKDKELFKKLSDKIKVMYYSSPPYFGEIEIKNIKTFSNTREISIIVLTENKLEREKMDSIFSMLGIRISS
jgi:hypothetical protein